MRKIILPCMLVLSFLTATAAQLSDQPFNSINDTIINNGLKEILSAISPIELEEVEDEPFDFNTEDYLPIGFDAHASFEAKYGIIYEVALEEEDVPFDFNTKDYLPIGFNLNKNILDAIVEIEIEEVEVPFDFDTKKYLPKGFDAHKKAIESIEL
tara:strand:+ start:4580 stop:5044 length:465 start_codon:yes stop_codon:yes gene_type:complete